MFLYPPSTWLYGGFDLMVEHGHRLLGSLAGLFAIGLVIAAWIREDRKWFKWWCVFVLLAVIAQGLLGGIRVRLDARTFAMIHGCTGQLFLAIATATAVMSSSWWRSIGRLTGSNSLPASKLLARAGTVLLIFAYCQVVAGAQVRHVTGGTEPSAFMGLVHIHLTLAFVVLIASLWVAFLVLKNRHLLGGVKWPGVSILFVVFIQICLGIATWIVNYALPWQEISTELSQYTIQSKGYWESMIVTAHVATGALIISLATVLCLRSWRSRNSAESIVS
jgi:cytochrome c oxidase assembly protein subunit 15